MGKIEINMNEFSSFMYRCGEKSEYMYKFNSWKGDLQWQLQNQL